LQTVPSNSNNSAGANSPANNYGGGGSGASKGQNNTDPLAGGNGTAGLVIVELYG